MYERQYIKLKIINLGIRDTAFYYPKLTRRLLLQHLSGLGPFFRLSTCSLEKNSGPDTSRDTGLRKTHEQMTVLDSYCDAAGFPKSSNLSFGDQSSRFSGLK
ncbi:hypothetical protein FQR65_LT13782 [Abscondita terminalis]|nr:hypothetical protein FQR65_LT13782 [Abscondita terminalis]